MVKIKKPTLVILLLMFIFAGISTYNAYAQTPELPNIKASWNDDLQQISVTWDKPLKRIAGQEIIVLEYKTPDSDWKTIQLSEGSTGKGIGNVEPNAKYTIRLRTYYGITQYTSNSITISTGEEFKFASWAEWTGSDIRIGWRNAQSYVAIDMVCSDKAIHPNQSNIGDNKSYNGTISKLSFLNHSDKPQRGETWAIAFIHDGQTYSHTVFCGTEKENKRPEDEEGIITPNKPGSGDSGEPYQIKGPIPIFTQETWPTVMFWYIILASLSGVFIFLSLIRSGYQYMFSATSNPGLKASFSETIEKCIIALVVIMAAPMLVGLLIQINDGLVGVFANVLDSVGKVKDIGLDNVEFEVNFINKMIAWPIKLIFVDLPNKLFGLHPLSHLIFNNETEIMDPCIFMGYFNSGDPLDLGDPLATVLVTLIFAVFNIIFNAIYTIRGWVVTAVLCATPLVVWIWVLSAQKTVIEIWLSELFQTIFMQTWHALTFAIVFSILLLRNKTPTAVPGITDNLAEILIMAGKFFAAFGGVICVGIIIYCSYKLIISLTVTGDSKHIAEYKANLQKSLIGLVILSLALIITQAIFPHEVPVLQPNISGGHTPKITVWQIFFAFFVILPISKMLSNIFMSLLARFGTVDEQALATRSFGMLGGLTALGAVSATGARNAFTSNEQQAAKIEEARRTMSSNTSPGGFSTPGGGPSSSPSGYGGSGPGGDNIFASSSGRQYEEPGIYPDDFSTPSGSRNVGSSGGTHNVDLPGSPSGDISTLPGSPSGGLSGSPSCESKDIFTGSPSGDSHDFDSSDYGIFPDPSGDHTSSTGDTYASDSPTQDDRFREMLGNAGLVGSGSIVAAGIENTMKYGGYLAGSVVGQGHVGATVFGGVGKHMGNVARTYSTGKQVYQSIKGENRTQTLNSLRDLAGSATNKGAIVKTSIGVALMPLGSHRASVVAKKYGSLLDYHM
jgi:hypothetical protein